MDLMVTKDHNQVVKFRKKKKGRTDAGIWKILPDYLLPTNDFTFLATIPNYQGIKKKTISIGSYVFSIYDFAEFMGYYLSEGSISKPKRGKWQIKLSQQKNQTKTKMEKVSKKLFGKVWVGKEYIYIPLDDDKVISYFKQFGHSSEKYIPQEIKECDKKVLKIFLDAFMLGDGSERKENIWKGYVFSKERMYFTSSDRLASDIGELILKIGHKPSYSSPSPLKKIKFKNGTYTQKHSCWRIRENIRTTPNIKRINKRIVKYKDYVYDVELEKNHTLFVRRNGKILLSGNCRCTIAPFIDEKTTPRSAWT